MQSVTEYFAIIEAGLALTFRMCKRLFNDLKSRFQALEEAFGKKKQKRKAEEAVEKGSSKPSVLDEVRRLFIFNSTRETLPVSVVAHRENERRGPRQDTLNAIIAGEWTSQYAKKASKLDFFFKQVEKNVGPDNNNNNQNHVIPVSHRPLYQPDFFNV